MPHDGDTLTIWTAGLEAVRPGPMVRRAMMNLAQELHDELSHAPRILVVGCGKAAAAMAIALEDALPEFVDKMAGLVNVPEGVRGTTRRIRLHPARPAGVNFPASAGVAGAEEMLALLSSAAPDDVAICLISGGGSALLPAPVPGITLEDKLEVTKVLHGCGATITEMNAVRKHLSRVKGGRLAEQFHGKRLISLIVSDVVGDPLDVIASGPTVPDPTTFQQTLEIISGYGIKDRVPRSALRHLERGANGEIAETPKSLPDLVRNVIIGDNTIALAAARAKAEELGYRVLDLGPYIEGETRDVAAVMAGIVRNIHTRGEPIALPVCILFGGETTVSLGSNPGKGGRNQEFTLALMTHLGEAGMADVEVLSAGTDGEDGPTDAAGAVATALTWRIAKSLGRSPKAYLDHHDAYHFFLAIDEVAPSSSQSLIRTGLTDTNVMDVRVVLVKRT